MLNPKNFLACGGLFYTTGIALHCIHHRWYQLVLPRRVERFPNGRVVFLYLLNVGIRVLADRYCFCEWQWRVPSTVKTLGTVQTRIKNGFANSRDRPSCNRKNAKVRGHSGTGVLTNGRGTFLHPWNTNNRPYVPTNHAIGLRTLKTTYNKQKYS